MRENIGDSSSAGSTPPPPNFDNFSPTSFLADPLSPKPPADDDLWKHLTDDGWYFFSDNLHDSQQLFNVGRPAASEPICQKNAGSRRPPRPCRGAALSERKRKQKAGMAEREPEAAITAYSSHNQQHQHLVCPTQPEWDNSNGNPSIVQSLASENDNDRCEILSTESGTEDEVQSDLPANGIIMHPEVGMEFFSEEEAYNFYKKYAEEIGFAVRKGKVTRLANGAIRKRNFLCSRQGFKMRKLSDKATKYERKETRTGCNASIQITVEDGKWLISNVALEHNHELDKEPWQSHDIEVPSSSTKITIENNISMRQGGGTAKYVTLQQVDRRLNILQPEDVQSLLNLFSDLQAKDPSFFYAIQVDAENHVTNFFWRDYRSRMDYGYFGDVIVFDTTFRIDNMIYAPFWGLNHHQQCVLFGCALLLEETLDSFLWLFKRFAVAMDKNQPRRIYSTEESQAISTAIEMVFPKTEHRLSVNSLCKNAKRHLPTYFEQPGFETLFNKCIFDCQTKQEFESQWNSLLEQYGLCENTWLTSLYKLWEKWSPLFCKKTFSAGIESIFDTSTSNTNFIFRSSSSEILTLTDFVQQYVKESKQRRSEELREDMHCNKTVSVRSRKGMEKHAEDIYTCTMFRKFQDELLDSLSLAIEEVTSSGSISTFKLTEEGNKKEDIVTFDSSSSTVTCSCAKFELVGILCSHSIKVLNAKNIFQIPPQYILKRWTKSAKEGDAHVVVVESEDDHTTGKSQRLLSLLSRNLVHKALNVISKSLAIEDSRKMVEGYLDLASKKADDILKEKDLQEQINLLRDLDEVNSVDCCGVTNDSRVVYMKSQKIASNSSCINQDKEGSKHRVKGPMQRNYKANVRESESQTQNDQFV